mmetsp:Transcript_21825/g.56914  ORF Transcript_21825/g.56914 Transcript_21825/m.56914 type:complete len:345 (+) Transcript_21825:2778-3812(+)
MWRRRSVKVTTACNLCPSTTYRRCTRVAASLAIRCASVSVDRTDMAGCTALRSCFRTRDTKSRAGSESEVDGFCRNSFTSDAEVLATRRPPSSTIPSPMMSCLAMMSRASRIVSVERTVSTGAVPHPASLTVLPASSLRAGSCNRRLRMSTTADCEMTLTTTPSSLTTGTRWHRVRVKRSVTSASVAESLTLRKGCLRAMYASEKSAASHRVRLCKSLLQSVILESSTERTQCTQPRLMRQSLPLSGCTSSYTRIPACTSRSMYAPRSRSILALAISASRCSKTITATRSRTSRKPTYCLAAASQTGAERMLASTSLPYASRGASDTSTTTTSRVGFRSDTGMS